MIRIENLSKHYGQVRAVDQMDLIVEEGSMVGIIGSSGAGKSTLLRLMNRLIDPTNGSIYFGEKEITSFRGSDLLDWRSNCAMIFQQFNLVERLDVLTNVLTGALRRNRTIPSLARVFPREQRTVAATLLDQLGILDQALKRCDQLSGGQQQRVAIARAMMQEPQILLADEPIASLDMRSATQVMDALKSINEENGITVLASIHDVAMARRYFPRLLGISHGKVVFDGLPEALTPDQVRGIYRADDAEEELRYASFDTGAEAEVDDTRVAVPAGV